jgi:hypothetical protein
MAMLSKIAINGYRSIKAALTSFDFPAFLAS